MFTERTGQVQVLRLSAYFRKNSSRSFISSDSLSRLVCFFFIKITAQHQHFTLKPARFSFKRFIKTEATFSSFSLSLSLFFFLSLPC